MVTAQAEAEAIKAKMDKMVENEENAKLEAKTGRDELKIVRKQLLKTKDELDSVSDEYKKVKVGNTVRVVCQSWVDVWYVHHTVRNACKL